MKKLTILLFVLISLYLNSNAQLMGGSKAKAFDVQMKNLTRQMVKSFGEEGKTQIAIMEFPDVNGKITELGKLIPEELTTRLFKTGEFQVIERQLLKKVLEEQKLGMSGMLDASSAAQIGKLLGVDAIVTGTVTDRGDAIRINARMIETNQAHVFAVASVSVIRENHLVTMMGKEIVQAPTSSASSESGSSSANNQGSTKAMAKAAMGDIKLEVKSVVATSGQKVKIEVVYTNKAKHDTEISFQGRKGGTIIYDNLGMEYVRSIINIGSKQSSSNGYSLSHRLISGVPTKVVYTFYDVDLNAEAVSLFKVYADINGEENSAEFRKLKFAR